MAAFEIIYENQEILLVNKPYGTSVQGGKGVLHPLDRELSERLGFKIHLVHRLDKDTSGILVTAKTPQAAAKWTNLIGTKQVTKQYTAICIGTLPAERGTLTDVIESHGKRVTATLSYVIEKTVRLTIPSAEPDSPAKELEMSLVRITLGTGRMHQIRIQLAKAGAPIAADDIHGNFKLNKLVRRLGIKKLCLSASTLTIPENGTDKTFSVPLPEHMQSILDKFFSQAQA